MRVETPIEIIAGDGTVTPTTTFYERHIEGTDGDGVSEEAVPEHYFCDVCPRSVSTSTLQYVENMGPGSLSVKNMSAGRNSTQIIRHQGLGFMEVSNMVAGPGSIQVCGSFDDGTLQDMLGRFATIQRRGQTSPHHPNRSQWNRVAEIAGDLLRRTMEFGTDVVFGTFTADLEREGWNCAVPTGGKIEEMREYKRRAGLDRETLLCAEVYAGVLAHLSESWMGQHAICPAWLWARRGKIFGSQRQRPKAAVEGMQRLIRTAPICEVRGGSWAKSNLVTIWQQARDGNRGGGIPILATFLALRSELPVEAEEGATGQ